MSVEKEMLDWKEKFKQTKGIHLPEIPKELKDSGVVKMAQGKEPGLLGWNKHGLPITVQDTPMPNCKPPTPGWEVVILKDSLGNHIWTLYDKEKDIGLCHPHGHNPAETVDRLRLMAKKLNWADKNMPEDPTLEDYLTMDEAELRQRIVDADIAPRHAYAEFLFRLQENEDV